MKAVDLSKDGAKGTETSAGQPPSARAAATRAGLLEAAREVFATAGYAEASVVDVVNRAGASVGSLYHHFDGKADLYLALFDSYVRRQEERASAAVHAVRSGREADAIDTFVIGARAYLETAWEERDLARIFLGGGGPPGFELLARRRHWDWVRKNQLLLHPRGADEPDALALVLTAVMGEAAREVILADSAESAQRLTDEVLALVAKIGD